MCCLQSVYNYVTKASPSPLFSTLSPQEEEEERIESSELEPIDGER